VKFGHSHRAYRFLAAAIAAACLLAPATARAQDIPADPSGFTSYVAEQMRAAIRDLSVDVKGPLTLAAGPMQANLDRVYSFCRTNIGGCAREIDAYVKGVVEAALVRGLRRSRKRFVWLFEQPTMCGRHTLRAHLLWCVQQTFVRLTELLGGEAAPMIADS
jgi:hypothetical protein